MFSPFIQCWYAISAELDAEVGVEVVDALDEADAADLEEVVGALAAAQEFLDHPQHQAQIALDQPVPRLPIAVVGFFQQRLRFLARQPWQRLRVDAADLHLALHPTASKSDRRTRPPPAGGGICAPECFGTSISRIR